MELFIPLLILIFINVNNSLASGLFGKVIQLDVFESCKPNMSTEIIDVVLSEDSSRKTLINATIRFHRDYDFELQQVMRVDRCKSKESPDTCVNLKTMKVTSSCMFYVAKNQFWTPFFANTKPAFKCPFKKGDYFATNAWFDADRAPFPVDRNSYWKIEITNFELPVMKQLMCLRFDGRVLPFKN